ncbi:MAG: helix-hairpin-helix domain-containing protein [Candidatus Hodarchaeales archaeon]|jgi:predicted flap endonuclease-1-like 5' DNA nuclease
MPSISIFLTEDPLLNVFAFKPGEKINIHIAFQGSNLPERYRLQILDHKQNSRLNRYGKSLSDIMVTNWPIPTTIRDEHLGKWQVKVDFSDIVQKQPRQESKYLDSLNQFFFVEHTGRFEFPLIGGERIFEIPTIVTSPSPVVEPGITAEIEPIIEEAELRVSSDPVTTIRGIGKAYSNRLVAIKVYTVSDFWNYSDRIHLAEIMRISDTRVEKMLNDAEIILSERMEMERRSEIDLVNEFFPNDLSTVDGIGAKEISRLKKVGIESKTDLLDFTDLNLIKNALKVNKTQFKSIMSSIGRILEPEEVKKPLKLSPYDELVIEVKGIGPVTAKKLGSVGVITVRNLIDSSYSDVQSVTTINSYKKWIKNASLYVGVEKQDIIIDIDEHPSSESLIDLPGVGVKTVSKLNNIDIHSIEDLKSYTDHERLRKILRMSEARFTKFMKSL